MRRFIIVVAGLTMLIGCSAEEATDLECESLLIRSPHDGASMDELWDMSEDEGFQYDVTVKSSLPGGTSLDLYVHDTSRTQHWDEQAIVGANGEAVFEQVTLPTGVSAIEVTARSECGEIGDSVSVE